MTARMVEVRRNLAMVAILAAISTAGIVQEGTPERSFLGRVVLDLGWALTGALVGYLVYPRSVSWERPRQALRRYAVIMAIVGACQAVVRLLWLRDQGGALGMLIAFVGGGILLWRFAPGPDRVWPERRR